VHGDIPFKGKDTVSTLVAVATEHPRPPHEVEPTVPRALSDLVMRLLAKQPADRPASAAAVVAAIQSIEESKTPSTALSSLSPARRERASTVDAASRAFSTVAFSPDGKLAAVGGTQKGISLWSDLDTAQPRGQAFARYHTAGVTSVAFTPDGKTLVSAGQDGRIVLWSTATTKKLHE
jgi:hypothetical protein